jgi:hypothetical protein
VTDARPGRRPQYDCAKGAVSAHITYGYDTSNGGRLSTRHQAGQLRTKTWRYDAGTGFLSSVTNEENDATEYVIDKRGNVTQRTTTRSGSVKNTEYFGYFDDDTDPLDPRLDVQIWSADARSADKDDTTYRTTRTINPAGHVTAVAYPNVERH